MQIFNILKLVFFVTLMCAGQIFFKKTAIIVSKKVEKISNFSNLFDFFLTIISTNYFFLALVTYGLATFYWLYLLQSIPLSMAYPFTALAMVIIPMASSYFFNETLDDVFWVGASLIFMGIIIISFSSKS